MRAKKKQSLSSIRALEETVDIDNLTDLFAPDLAEEPDALVENRIFELLRPGHERTIILLKTSGLSYKAIGDTMGLSEVQVRATIYLIRAKLIRLKQTRLAV